MPIPNYGFLQSLKILYPNLARLRYRETFDSLIPCAEDENAGSIVPAFWGHVQCLPGFRTEMYVPWRIEPGVCGKG